VLKYYWEVIRRYKVSFFTVLILTIFYSVLDVYIPLQYLKLWDILSTNDFTVVEAAKFIKKSPAPTLWFGDSGNAAGDNGNEWNDCLLVSGNIY